jgi:membrane protein required for colicin V production
MHNMAWVDLLLLGLLLASAVVGLWRGLLFELMSLAGWLVAYFAAHWLSPEVAPHLPVGTPGSALNQSAAFILSFIAVLIAWSLLARLLRLLLRATPLSLLDRLLGALFGAVRGLLIALLLSTVVSWTPWVRSEAWAQSQARPWLEAARDALMPLLPEPWARNLRA